MIGEPSSLEQSGALASRILATLERTPPARVFVLARWRTRGGRFAIVGAHGPETSAADVHERRLGRACARRALHLLGRLGTDLPRTSLGAPVWPAGFTGSISHTEGFACAAAARGPDGFGIDVERIDRPVSEAAWRRILDDHEAVAVRGRDRYAVFSAKESFYKMAAQLVGRLFWFDAVQVTLDGKGTFEVRLLTDLGPDLRSGHRHQGRYLFWSHFVMTWIHFRGGAGTFRESGCASPREA